MYNNTFGYNPYYQQPRYPIGVPQPMDYNNTQNGTQIGTQPVPNMQNNVMPNRTFLNGKSVDSIDVVKATEIPLDGSISYFPLTDGSAIITKKLGQNGTSEIEVFKPVVDENKNTTVKENNTISDELLKKLDKLDNNNILSDLLEEMKNLKDELKSLKPKSKVKES